MERQLRLPGTLPGAPCLDHATLVRLLRKPGTQDIKGEREHETVQPAQIPEKSNRTLTTTTRIRVPPLRRAQSFGSLQLALTQRNCHTPATGKLALKNHAVARLFPFVSSATIKIWRKTPAFPTMKQRLKHLIFFTLLDDARACEIRLDKHLSLSRLFHFDTQRL
jgi:hypothetical protein